MKSFLLSIPVLLLCLLFATPGFTTDEYARATGKACSACHLDPAGGGELTASGMHYRAARAGNAGPATPTAPRRIVRCAVGYLHMITAFLWFGTILYVHLVLKPAYAAQGLPKGEVRVGLVSMAVMALTGSVLTMMRVPSLDILFQTRFGILLTIKIALFLIMVMSALVVVLIIGPRLRRRIGGDSPDAGRSGILTPQELSQYDGADERPAFFAYNGRIFDVSASRLWKNGMHMGRHPAGTDLTGVLKLAPHGEDKVLAMPVVARLADAGTALPPPLHQRVFFFMAYMNLGMVFAIVLILALWRWW